MRRVMFRLVFFSSVFFCFKFYFVATYTSVGEWECRANFMKLTHFSNFDFSVLEMRNSF